MQLILFQDSKTTDGSAAMVLNEGDIFNSVTAEQTETVNAPRARHPLKPKRFLLLDTPYVSCLRYVTF